MVLSGDYNSESGIGQISVDMLQGVVPVELPVAQRHLPDPVHHQLEHLVKVPAELESMNCTYCLPVFTLLGLMSARLKAAKKSSQGAAS